MILRRSSRSRQRATALMYNYLYLHCCSFIIASVCWFIIMFAYILYVLNFSESNSCELTCQLTDMLSQTSLLKVDKGLVSENLALSSNTCIGPYVYRGFCTTAVRSWGIFLYNKKINIYSCALSCFVKVSGVQQERSRGAKILISA